MPSKTKTDAVYEALGASASKAGLHETLKRVGLESSHNTFAVLNSDLTGDKEYRSFLHSDGAGTKTIVSYLMFQETKNAQHFSGLAQDALVMNLDDIFCLGVPERLLLSNTVQRNANLVGDDALEAIIRRYTELVSLLESFGIPIELAGGETADCGDVVRTLLVDATLSGRIKESSIIYQNRIAPGDVIVGLSNTGKATYEEKENSSIGSNGLTLARHALLDKQYKTAYPEVADPAIDNTLSYHGPYRLTDQIPGLSLNVGEALISPTRTYAPLLVKIYNSLKKEIHGAIHLTGGGQTKMLRFGEGNLYIKDNLFSTPPLFELIQKHGAVSWKEMYRVFNMGHRFELYLKEPHVKEVIDTAKSFGVEAKIIGRVEKNTDKNNKLILKSPHGEFEYSL